MTPLFKKIFNSHRVKCFYGGRGSSKSWSVAEALIEIAVWSAVRVLCLRRVQKSIAASSHQLLSDTITRLGYESEFTITKTSITSKSGAEFIFMGLASNLDSVKSIEGVDIAWIEEAHSISREAWDILLPTIRRFSSEVWVTFNPDYAWEDTYVRFVLNADDSWLVICVNWRDNPHFTPELEAERLHCLKFYPDRYQNIWEGVPISDLPGSVIGRGSIERCIVEPDSPLARVARNGIITCWLDVADDGDDDSVLSIFDGNFLISLERMKARDVVQLADQALMRAKEVLATELGYDGIGVGAGVKGELNKHTNEDIIFRPFIASAAPLRIKARYRGGRSNGDTFENLRAQAWWSYRDAVNDSIRFLDDGVVSDTGVFAASNKIPRRYLERLLSDSSAPLWEVNASGKIQIESKKSMKKRLGISPDYADAVIPKTVRMGSGLGVY
ncbi:TPA: PBSX family phage terminase large subunit [Yersinia enterocolitica]|nr:PBSX family phage terminase large subunit [Yersinia enterocolitica]